MNTVEKLDAIAEYQAQIDYLEMKKRELIDAVKVPDEVCAVQDQSIQRKRAADAEYQAKQTELARQKQELLATVVVPPEIRAAFDAVEKQRAEIERDFAEKISAAWGDACRKKEEIDRQLTDGVAEVYAQVEQRKQEIEAEFSGKAQAAQDNIEKLTAEIKAEVIAGGSTVKGAHYQAVYTRGRVSWDTAKLDGLMILLPQLKEARKEGAPSVSIRRID